MMPGPRGILEYNTLDRPVTQYPLSVKNALKNTGNCNFYGVNGYASHDHAPQPPPSTVCDACNEQKKHRRLPSVPSTSSDPESATEETVYARNRVGELRESRKANKEARRRDAF